jgi:tRNA 2-thiocytidine biosynthesis protein TtcA
MEMPTADKKIFKKLGRAIRHYELIDGGERIAVAVSGGKDSLSLLWLLRERLRWIPKPYELIAVHLDMGFSGTRPQAVEAFCRSLEIPFHFEQTDYGVQAHGPENRENPCFLCARLRRRRLFEMAHSLGCSKLALGHNQDDIIETFFLNIFFGGQISTMVPRQILFQGALTLIRPLTLLGEREIQGLVHRRSWPQIINPCPSAGRSSREQLKKMLTEAYVHNQKIKGNIFNALSNVRTDYLLPPIPRGKRRT